MHDYRQGTYRLQGQQAQRRAVALRALDTRAINLLLLLAAVVLFVTYLALNNRASTRGFVIRDLEDRIAGLESERQKLDLAVVAGHSMETIDGRIQELGFVPVGRMEFVDVPGAVAVR